MWKGEVGERPSANSTQGGDIVEHDKDSTGSVHLSITDSHSKAIDFVAIRMYCDYKLSSVTLQQRHKETVSHYQYLKDCQQFGCQNTGTHLSAPQSMRNVSITHIFLS